MEKTDSTQTKSDTKKIIPLLSSIALAGICLFIILVLVLHFLPTGYDPVSRPTSEYAVGSYGFLMTAAFLCMSIACFALLAGLYNGMAKLPKVGLVLFGIWAVGVLIAMIFPISPEGMPATTSGKIHQTNGPIVFLSLTIGVILISANFRRNENWRSIYRPALAMSIIMLLIFISIPINFAMDLNIAGLLQRFFLIVFSTWFIMVVLNLRKIKFY